MSIELRRIGLKGLLASVAIAGMTAGLATAQIAANENATVSQMETLLEGQGIDVTNLQVAAGTNQQYGSFSNGLGTVNIGSGVYISTGQGANFAQIATNQSDITNNGNTPDSDLTALRATATNDTAALQMTVTPAANTIRARMVFASEEYPEYVCSTFNDAFGLFVSGPGVTGTMNFAQVPGSNTDISINTVNNGLNNDGQVCAGETSNNSTFYNDNPTGASFIFDGYTDAIEVTMFGVTPGEDYVFKMAVADAIDTVYDSAVFVDFLESIWEHTADLSLDLTASTQAPVIGQNFTITATISNAGPDEVPFFKVADILPAGLTFVSASGDGTYDDTNDEWSSTASIAANGTMTMTLTVNATAAGTYTTASEVIEQWSDDVDSTPNDGEGDDYDTLSVNVVQVDRSDTPVAGTSYGEVTHVLTTGIQLGTAIDADTLSIANADASGDGADDDGVNFPALRPGDSTVIRVRVAQASGNSGYLQGWIDWNGDGSFGAGEQIAIDLQSATAGTSFIYLPVTVPATMTTNQTFARFRWSTTQGLDATTAADDGEVEDYAVTASAPAAPVFSPSCVAATVENGGFELPAIAPGANVEQDENLVPGWSTDATDNNIERWGTWFYNIPSSVGAHYAELNASQVAALTQDIGTAQAGDTIEWSYWHRGRAGTDTMTFGVGVDGGATTVLQTATTGNTAWVNYTGSASVPVGNLRFEFRSVSSAGGNPSIGNFLDDFHFAICPVARDYSDAPLDGSTAPNGTGITAYGVADHALTSTTTLLGAAVDGDTPPIGNANATGDGGDDDGVTLPTLTQGLSATISVDVTQASGNSGYLQGWIDWNGDGDFDDPAEQIATDLQSTDAGASTISVPVTVPAIATTTPTFARFRWSTTQGLDSTSAASDGEVEDYQITIVAGDGGSPVLPPVCTTGQRATLDWSSSTWPQGSLSNSFAVNNASITVDILDPQNALNGPTPVNAAFYQGGLASIDNTLIIEADDADLANGDVTIRYTFSRSVEEVRVSLFDLDFSDLGPRIERATITAYSGATPVPVTLQGGSAILISGNSAFGIAESDPFGAASGDGTVQIGVTQPIDRLEISYGHGAGTDRTSNPGNPGFGLHDLSFCAQVDRSDAPMSYGDADHVFAPGQLLGTRNDVDADNILSVDATGDGGDDDGVILPTLTHGLASTISVDVTGAGYLQAWIDFDGDTSFGGSGEQIASDIQDGGVGDTDGVANGTIVLSVTPPANGFTGTSYARFRWSTDTGLSSTGSATDGEVEDYAVIIRDLDELAFTPDQRRTVIPGTVVLYPHTLYVPEDLSGGTLAFAQTSDQSLNWTIWRDVDASGDLSAADVQWMNGAALPATGELGFIVQAQIAGTVPAGWRDISEFTATVTLGSQTRSSSVTDVTDVSGLDAGTLTAAKFLAIDTDCDGALTDESAGDAAFEIGKQGAPGTCVVYRITFRNDSTAAVTEVVVRDMVPAWTSYVAGSANYETVPSGMTAGTATEPTAGQRGALAFPFTGSLAAGAGGAVSYEVKIDE